MAHNTESKQATIEYVLWGKPKGETDALYEKVLTCTTDQARVEEVKVLAAKEGWHGFRVQKLDLSTPPDFISAVTGKKR